MSRVLFVMLHPGFVRYYDEALDALAAAGHDVHVAFEVNRTKLREDITATRLAARSPRIACGPTPERRESVRDFLARGDREATRSGTRGASPWSRKGREEAWESLATTARLLLDYLRFFEPAFAHAPALRARAEKRLPRVYQRLVKVVSRGGRGARSMLAAVLSAIERMIPPNRAIDDFIRGQKPDVLLVTPLIELGSQQVDYIKSARQLGVRSALCVASWDNLTSKGLIRVVPDHVIVWNDVQKREAVELHGVEPDRVIVTGAQVFDRWFNRQPSRRRADFLDTVGLNPERPFVLYVGSSIFIAPDEVPFVEKWLAALRASSDPAVASLGVLIRPHPANSRQWRAFDAGEFGNVAIWPPIGTDPNDADFRNGLFDSLFFSAGVVGINTSAQLEAGIVGRPVFTVQLPEFAHAQEGTLHFRHLIGDQGGLVRSAATLDEHVAQLGEALRSGGDASAANRAFVGSFIRPFGIDAPATPRFTQAVANLARLGPPAPRREGWWAAGMRPAAFVMARIARVLAEDRPVWVYAARPVMAAGIWTWAAVFEVREGSLRALPRQLRRMGRRAHGAWYESSREIGKRTRRVGKKVAAGVRGAGVAVKRAARRAEGRSGG